MKTKLMIMGLLAILFVGCSRDYNIKGREAYIPGNERFSKDMENKSTAEYNHSENVEKYNLPISEEVIYAYDSYRQFWICIGCFLKVRLTPF